MSGRLETGVFTPAGDWPGILIRGDNALMGYLPAVKTAIAALREARVTTFQHATALAELENLAKLLGSCYAGNQQPGNSVTIAGTQVQQAT